MKKIFYQILKNNQNIFLFLFKYLYFLQIIPYCKLSKCNNIDLPFFKGDTCVKSCKLEEIKNETCFLKNEILKTQKINNINYMVKSYCLFDL